MISFNLPLLKNEGQRALFSFVLRRLLHTSLSVSRGSRVCVMVTYVPLMLPEEFKEALV